MSIYKLKMKAMSKKIREQLQDRYIDIHNMYIHFEEYFKSDDCNLSTCVDYTFICNYLRGQIETYGKTIEYNKALKPKNERSKKEISK